MQRLHDQRDIVISARLQKGAQPLKPERTDPAVRIAEHIAIIPGVETGRRIKFFAHREPFVFLGVSGASKAVANHPVMRQSASEAFSAIAETMRE
ncbi:MAG: hypothetical protein Devi2KO_27870 [Devosia indica]